MKMSGEDVRRDRRRIEASIDDWVKVSPETMSPDDAIIFDRRRSAIELYAGGASLKQITAETSIKAKDIYRFLDRCEVVSGDGRKNGWRGIIPNSHVMPRRRTEKRLKDRIGHANEFAQFLANFPQILANLHGLTLNGWRPDEKGPKRKLSIMSIKEKIHEDCKRAGLSVLDYPLSMKSGAYGSFRRYVNALRRDHCGGKYPAGEISQLLPAEHCYQRVEADGHWKDLICTVELPSPTSRGVLYIPIERLWLIPVIESVSTAVLGYAIAYGHNYSGEDLIRAVRSSVLPWVPLPHLTYRKGGGFPTGVDEALAYVCYDEILLDNHKGHLSAETISQLHRSLGTTPVYGSIDNQNMRALVEGFFNEVEKVLHELPNSIGSNPKNMPVSDPTGNAVKYSITDQHIHDIVELLLARYNSESPPGSSLSRIEILQRHVRDPRSLVRRIPKSKRQNIDLYDFVLTLTIRGNQAEHIRPHVYWSGSNYTNPIISSNYGLVGIKLRLYGNSHDIRKLKGYFPTGSDAGELICERRFSGTPHSSKTRKHANASRRAGGHRATSDGDEIAGYCQSMMSKATSSKSAATEVARLMAEIRAMGLLHPADKEIGNKEMGSDAQFKNRSDSQASEWDDRLKKMGTRF